MKNTIIMTLLGLAVTVVSPSIAVADSNDKKWQSNNNHTKNHVERKRHGDKPSKQRHFIKHHRDNVVRHDSRRHHNSRRHHQQPKTSLSITFGNTQPRIVYGNSYRDRHTDNGYRTRNNKKRIYQRIDKQSRRIQKGINRGQLVRKEVRTLRKEQNRISRKVSKFNRDGRLDRRERSKLNHLLDVENNNIRRLRHNHYTRNSHRDNDRYVRR